MGCQCENCQCSGSENITQIIGQKGDKGDVGATPTIAQGTVSSLPAGSPPTVTLVDEGNNTYHYNFAIPAGENGTNGTNGTNGWSPVLAVVSDGSRRVLQIVSWTGGTGSPPSSIDQYIGPTGIVSTAAAASDIRGAAGSSAAILIGTAMEWDGDSDPAGGEWLIEDGREISRTTYAAYFAIVGTKHGVGNGTTTFNIADSRGRAVFGKDGTTEFSVVGTKGGAKTKILAASNLPVACPWAVNNASTGISITNNASFIYIAGSSNGLGAGPIFTSTSTPTISDPSHGHTMASNVGGGQAFSILPPYITKNKIVKVL